MTTVMYFFFFFFFFFFIISGTISTVVSLDVASLVEFRPVVLEEIV